MSLPSPAPALSRSLRTRVREAWLEVLVTILVAVVQLRDVLWAGADRVVANPDTQLHYWTLWWWSEALWNQPLAVWHAPQFVPYDYTLAYSDHLAPLGLVSAPLIWLGVPIALILNVAVVGSAVLTVWAMRALARDIGAARWPALLVGLAVGFGTFRTTQVTHLQMLATWMLPLAVLWLRHATRSARWWSWPALGVVLVLAGAFGLSIYHGFMMLPVLVLVATHSLMHAAPAQRMAGALRLAVLAGVAAVAMLPSLWPYLQVQRTTAVTRSLVELANWSAPLQAWWAVPKGHPLWPWIFGEWVTGRPELVLAPGMLLTIGAVLGLGVRNATRWLWLLVAVMGVVLASGSVVRLWDGGAGIDVPFARWIAAVPGYSALRVPARWGWIVTFGLALLAALGLSRPWVVTRRWPLVVAAVVLVGDMGWPSIPTMAAPLHDTPRPVYSWLATQSPVRTVLELPLNPAVESALQAERLWWQTIHGQRIVTGYSGIAPATQILLARDAAHLPRPDVVARIGALGVDTVLVHRDSERGQAHVAAMEACALCTVLYDAPDAVVYTIPPSSLAAPAIIPGTRVWISADPRLPDLVALGMRQSWQTAGAVVVGPARQRFYGAKVLPVGVLPDEWLLGANEEPESVGVTAADAVATGAGGVRYRRPTGLLLAQPVVFASGRVTVAFDANGSVRMDDAVLTQSSAAALTMVFDAAVLRQQRIAGTDLGPGAQLVTLAVQRGSTQTIVWDAESAALVRLRVYDRGVAVPALRSVPLAVGVQVDGDALVLRAGAADVQLQGIEDATGKAVTHPLPAGATTRVAAGEVPALATGHYQVVVVTTHGQRIVVANLWVTGSGWRWQAIPQPLTLVY